MYTVEEMKTYFGKGYLVKVGAFQRDVKVISIVKKLEGYTYMLLIDSYGNTIIDAYRYLNYHLEMSTYKKRELTLSALKLLYSFIEIFNIDSLENIDKEYRNKLIGFLRGGEFESIDVTYNVSTRENSTINNYFSVYRAYFKYLKIKGSVFEDSSITYNSKGGKGFLGHVKKVQVSKFNMSQKMIQKKEVPKYIRFDEYNKILKLIDEKYSNRELIIFRLMYEYGCRIGEVLGLTLEDFIFNDDAYNTGNCSVILRNRLSDRPYQFAKGSMKITNETDYNQKHYFDDSIGYQELKISSNLAKTINDYIDETRSPFQISDKCLSNLLNYNKADKVTDREDIENNQYIFLGKNYTPITSKGWNDVVKAIFEQVGIPIDKEKRVDNLNHRFRHGYAMFKVLVEKYDAIRLSHALRHSNTLSVNIYFNPTEEDIIEFAKVSQQLLEKAGIKFE